jgi:lysophospholipase L1-like esterase
VPAFASSQIYPASAANDSAYSTVWRGSIPGWIAYDLSAVPAIERGSVIAAWFNDPTTSPYDHVVAGDIAYNSLRDYTIEANAAPGGGSVPTSGWVTLTTVTGNRYHSRQHLVDLTGYDWIRLDISSSDGSPLNEDAAVNFDVYTAPKGVGDSWIFYGDSITMDGMHHAPVNRTANFSQLVHVARPTQYPVYENGGIGGLTSLEGAQNIGTWLAVFPGRYVGLSYGTNDANVCAGPVAFYNNYATMVRAVLAAGKVPVVPTIPWARTANVRRCAPKLNAALRVLYASFPRVVKGPDFWSYFCVHRTLISGDSLHPSRAGYAAYRRQWVTSALRTVYARRALPPARSVRCRA